MSSELIGEIHVKVMSDKSVIVEMSGKLTGALINGHVLRAIHLCYAREYKRELFKEAEKVRLKFEEMLKEVREKESIQQAAVAKA